MTSSSEESSTNADVPADNGADAAVSGAASETPADDATPGDGNISDEMTAGRRVVFYIYLASIGVAALFGGVLGVVLQRQDGPSMGTFGPITFELTPVTLAIFGMVMVGALLTVGLLLVQYVSARFS